MCSQNLTWDDGIVLELPLRCFGFQRWADLGICWAGSTPTELA